MNQDPNAIRRDIEDTQTRMGGTVEALAYKADVPARTRDAVNDRIDTIKGAVSSAANALPLQNPLGVAIGSIAVGFLIGLCLPVTDIERERVGPLGEAITDKAKAAAADAVGLYS